LFTLFLTPIALLPNLNERRKARGIGAPLNRRAQVLSLGKPLRQRRSSTLRARWCSAS